jgi:uncharacterized membrane protein
MTSVSADLTLMGTALDTNGTPTPKRRHALLKTWRFTCLVLLAQLLALVVYSQRQYSRFNLSIDFAQANQATWLITHGHFIPNSSIHNQPFLDDHFSLIMWPIALIYALYPHGITLLIIQDISGVLAEMIVLLWITESVARRFSDENTRWTRVSGRAIILGALVVLIANPWFYQASFTDFHVEALATVFALLALRCAWHDRTAIAAAWCIPLIACGDIGGLFLIGIGLSVLLTKRQKWIWGAGGIVVGWGWIQLADFLGVHNNSVLSGYSYLLSGSSSATAHVTFASLLVALVAHPDRWLRVLWQRKSLIYENLIPTGLIGVFSGWALGTEIVIFMGSAIILPLVYLQSGFQNLPGYLVVLAGSGIIISRLAISARLGIRRLSAVLGILIVVQSVAYGIATIPTYPSQWITFTQKQAVVLDRALRHAHPATEVIASWAIIGRFSDRQYVRPLYVNPQGFSVNSSTVEFVISTSGNEILTSAQSLDIVRYIQGTLHAQEVASGGGVYAFIWHPHSAKSVVLS